MKLLKIKFTNIGPYHIEEIDFKTTQEKNIVLLCGENGAGKTTFLKAVKIGLFGGTLFGLKHQSRSNTYIDEVKSVVRHGVKNGTIEISFSIVEDYKEVEYKIIRTWDIDPSFKEKVSLYISDKRVSEKDLYEKLDYISNYYTPGVLETIMFDGEKIIKIANEKNLSEYVREAINNLFGLNNYYNLIKSLEKYIDQSSKNNQLTVEQITLNELENTYKANKKNIQNLEDKIISLKKVLQFESTILEQRVERYAKLGGLKKQDINSAISQLNDFEKNREQYKAKTKFFIENDLLFLMNKKNISSALKQIEKEIPATYIKNIEVVKQSNLLDKSDIANIDIILKKLSSNIEVDSYINLDMSSYNKFSESSNMAKYAKTKYNNLIKSKFNSQDVLSSLREKVQITKTPEMEALLEEIGNLILSTDKVRFSIEQEEESITLLNMKLDQSYLEYTEYKQFVFDKYKEDSSYVLARKYIDVCEEFCKSEVERITKEVSISCTDLIKRTYRKNEYITKFEIDSDFTVRILNNDGVKQISQLSAGEKQILVASIISSIVKTSNRNLFLVFDTPAGRLDNEHKNKFYKNIMSEIANQVIIMPTSNEINDDVINEISNKISSCNTITYESNGYSRIYRNNLFGKEWYINVN